VRAVGGPPGGLYVETRVRAPLDVVWRLTQDPAEHARWDLRFSTITPTGTDAAGRSTFCYSRRVGPYLLTGTGVHSGERDRPDGSRTSALRWTADDELSLVGPGSGYWRYVPDGDGTRFLTGYDYAPGWGRLGPAADRLVFRRVLWWMTAFSFDRLRLWAERGVPPERSRNLALADALARAGGVVLALAATRRRSGPARLLAAVAALAAAVAVPAPDTVPRAGRCRRRPEGRR